MDVKYTTTTYEDDMCIVRVHKPILTEEEYKRREAKLIQALIRHERARIKRGTNS